MIRDLFNLFNLFFKCKYLGTFENTPVYLNNEFVKNAGYRFSVVFKKCDDSGFIIAVDDTFFRTSKTTQKYLLYHEIGHILNGHLDMKKCYDARVNDVLNNTVSYMELEADMYACNKIGASNFIKSIDELIKFSNNYNYTIKEFILRKNKVLEKLGNVQ